MALAKEPIIAIATAPGRGAVGIVRISGTQLTHIVDAVCGIHLVSRQATYTAFKDNLGQTIDKGLAIFFPSPHSYTGEDVLELQAHGGPVILQLLLARCLEAGKTLGIRLARAGEFTERAFLNNKLDLAQAEAVADIIDASTEAAARSASRSLSGEFSQAIHNLLESLIHLRMLIEATIDFPEEDIDFLKQNDALGKIEHLQNQLATTQQKTVQGALLREGIKLVIAGQPNSGKSSLLNALAGAELAIVTPIAGTTRDVVQQTIQIKGIPIHVLDTAGLRDSSDEVEKIGIARAWEHMNNADVVIFLRDVTQINNDLYMAGDDELLKQIPKNITILEVWNKSDLYLDNKQKQIIISAKTGFGLNDLRQKIIEAAGWKTMPDGVFMARQRHIQALQIVHEHFQNAKKNLINSYHPALEIIAEELRLAQNALSTITGEFTPDDLLGNIFSNFCIGK